MASEVYLALFAYGGVHPDTVACLLRDLPRLSGRYHQPSGDADIYRNRSKVASAFLLDEGTDVLLMIDHDMSWSQGSLERLVEKAREHRAIVGAVCPKRGFGAGVATRFFTADSELTVPTDELVEVSAVGAALTAIHRDVIDAVKGELKVHETFPTQRVEWYPIFRQSFVLKDGDHFQYNGEDFDLCDRARQMGFKVYADLLPTVRHHGDYGFSIADATKRTDV
jgi:hypothetical protein